ncbi:MAG: DUF4783 domain-containing protein [Bacteroidetes bacterium]|nr:DUF4783 domain-containing protein [Bacteroidota bacterium]
MNKKIFILSVFLIAIFFFFSNSAQEKERTNDSEQNRFKESAIALFQKIENGISSGKVSNFSKFFSSQIYLSLSNGVNGYYSSNQAYYVLVEYFKMYQSTSFELGNMQEDESGMSATGSYNYIFKGKREAAQVYVSLKSTGKKWKITQITIN